MNPSAFLKTTPQTVKEPCAGAPLPKRDPATGVIPYADLVGFGIRQTGQLELCEGKRALAVDSDKIHNEYVERLEKELKPKKPWYKIW